MQKYYPEPTFDSIAELIPEEPVTTSCDGVIISEIFSYYAENPSEQFVEFYNPSQEPIILDSCSLQYKNTKLPLTGTIPAGFYYLFQDSGLLLTKNPVTSNQIAITDSKDNIIIATSYYHGQKKGTSYAIFDISQDKSFWRQTYFPTPGSANIYQEFQTCPVGKTINPATGNCVNKSTKNIKKTVSCPAGKYLNPLTGRCKKVQVASTLTPCKEGYERNPQTNRCRKITSATTSLKSCKEGYERNPTTNRCRKIRENTGETIDYAPAPTDDQKYQNPKVFIGIIALAIAIVAGIAFVIFQYRVEIYKGLKFVFSRFRKL